MLLVIHGRLAGLNEYTNANRTNIYAGAKMKSDAEKRIASAIHDCGLKPIHGKVRLQFAWYEKDRRRDLDNVCFAKKFILDSLVRNGIIAGDGWKTITGFTDEFYVDKENPRIEVQIT